MEIQLTDIENIILAALLGAAIGLERQFKGKPAGFRTLMLVSVSAAIFTIVSFKMALLDPNSKSDVTRIASSIVTGIGFIGAGLIFRTNAESVKGLTTATSVWAASAIGMMVAINESRLAVIATILILVILYLLNLLEGWLTDRRDAREYKISWKRGQEQQVLPEMFFPRHSCKLVEDKQYKYADRITVMWRVTASRKVHTAAIEKMIADERIVGLEY